MVDDAAAPAALDARMGFCGIGPTRDIETRAESCVADALADPRARLVLRDAGGRWLIADAGAHVDLAGARALGLDVGAAEIHLLGTADDGAPLLAAAAPGPFADLATADGDPPGPAGLDLRSIGMRGLASSADEATLGLAAHLLNWHARNRFCGSCGSPNAPELGGARRRCGACGDIRFPRTDPVAIMLVHDGAGACVLGRQPRFPPGMWSCLAGFVEPAETIEAAVRRETREEAGLAVDHVSYVASQPWPFPGSLMIGCLAQAIAGPIVFDRAELEDCRWFGRDEVQSMLAGAHPDGLAAPQPFAIAHHLIRAFAEGRE